MEIPFGVQSKTRAWVTGFRAQLLREASASVQAKICILTAISELAPWCKEDLINLFISWLHLKFIVDRLSFIVKNWNFKMPIFLEFLLKFHCLQFWDGGSARKKIVYCVHICFTYALYQRGGWTGSILLLIFTLKYTFNKLVSENHPQCFCNGWEVFAFKK